MIQNFSQQGILVDPVPTKVGDRITIAYNGLLSQSGADQVWLHCGYGTQSWEGIYDYPMERSIRGWEKTFEISNPGQFNFCFKDSANNWDNNNGMNWSYRISQ